MCSFAAWGGTLVPPPGFFAGAADKHGSARSCPPVAPPFTGKLEFPSKFEGSDKARDDLNPKAQKKYREKTAPITALEKEVSQQIDVHLRSGQPEPLACALNWLDTWARARALTGPSEGHTGKAVRKWALASLASSWLRLKFSQSKPLALEGARARVIEQWFGELAGLVVAEWDEQPLDKMNNHEYWAAWAVMATAVALDRRDLFDWSLAQYRIAAGQVDADGYLPNELKRDTRALAYHNYALAPLTMIAAFARANGVDAASEGNRALQRLATRVLDGIETPELFEKRVGSPQNLDDIRDSSKLAWLEPYCWMYACEGSVKRRLEEMRPMKTYRLGGNLTDIFASAPRPPERGRNAFRKVKRTPKGVRLCAATPAAPRQVSS